MTDAQLDELRTLGEELRQVLADERAAIVALDHERLELLAHRKRMLADQLHHLDLAGSGSPVVRALFAAIRIEARATAMLAATATDAVRKLLGYETGGYDRRAKRVTNGPSMRILAAY